MLIVRVLVPPVIFCFNSCVLLLDIQDKHIVSHLEVTLSSYLVIPGGPKGLKPGFKASLNFMCLLVKLWSTRGIGLLPQIIPAWSL